MDVSGKCNSGNEFLSQIEHISIKIEDLKNSTSFNFESGAKLIFEIGRITKIGDIVFILREGIFELLEIIHQDQLEALVADKALRGVLCYLEMKP